MSEQLERQAPALPAEIPNVLTGELVSTSDISAMARYLDGIREHERSLRDLKRLVERVIVEYAQAQGTKTLHLDGLDARISGPKPEWDVEKLETLLEAGLPYERYNELVTIEHVTKINGTVANSIAGSNPKYAEIIAAAKSISPGPERVTIVS